MFLHKAISQVLFLCFYKGLKSFAKRNWTSKYTEKIAPQAIMLATVALRHGLDNYSCGNNARRHFEAVFYKGKHLDKFTSSTSWHYYIQGYTMNIWHSGKRYHWLWGPKFATSIAIVSWTGVVYKSRARFHLFSGIRHLVWLTMRNKFLFASSRLHPTRPVSRYNTTVYIRIKYIKMLYKEQ